MRAASVLSLFFVGTLSTACDAQRRHAALGAGLHLAPGITQYAQHANIHCTALNRGLFPRGCTTLIAGRRVVFPTACLIILTLFRASFIPIIASRSLGTNACHYRDAFSDVLQSRRREHLFVEVVLIDGLNDSPELARALAVLLRPLPTRASINLLPYNDTGHALFRASTKEAVEEFQRVLTAEGLIATIRTAR